MWRRGLALMAFGVAAVACSSSGSPPFIRDAPTRRPADGNDGGPGDGLITTPAPTPPALDAGGLCGNLVLPIVTDRPNLYFIVDGSDSMNEYMPRESATNGVIPRKYTAARTALESVLRAVGHRVSYGAAWFPGPDTAATADGCQVGTEIFPTQEGDPASYAVAGREGPVLTELVGTLRSRTPSGATPTAKTLRALRGPVLALQGKTFAFLLTDGAPNCNADAACTKEQCTPNIEGGCPDASVNCCDPSSGVEGADPRLCLDAEPTTTAVAALADAGVPTFIVGMPGTDEYTDLLDRLATAGKTARDTPPYYYPVSTSTELTDTLRKLALSVSVSCDIAFPSPPPDKALVNVFFDRTVVPFEPENGWIWESDDHLTLVGQACDQLKNGDVLRVQVVSGCPSVIR
jgi:hypothetical protein